MGKQIRFYMSPEDEERFKDYILRTGEMIYEDNENDPVSISELLDTERPFWFHLSLCFKNEPIEYDEVSSGRKYINALEANIIQWFRTSKHNNGKYIKYGRLWVEMYTYIDGEKIYKGEELDNWYKDLCKWIRKNIPRREIEQNGDVYKEYISDSIYELVQQGYKLF